MKAEATNGTTLEQLLQGGAPIAVTDAISILRNCAVRLDTLPHAGRLTPARVQLDSVSDIHIEDEETGAGSAAADQALPAPQHAAYLSPEEILGTPTDRRSSEFSLGVIAYEMLTARKPFRETKLSALIYEICSAEPPRADSVNPGLSAAAADVVQRALAKDPGQRFSSCEEFVDTLETAVGQPSLNKPLPVPLPVEEEVREQQPAPAVPDLPAARRRRSFDTDSESAPAPPAEPRTSGRMLFRMAIIGVLAAILLVFLIDRRPSPTIPQQTIDPRVGPVGPPPPPEDNSEDENGSAPTLGSGTAPRSASTGPKSGSEKQNRSPSAAPNRPAKTYAEAQRPAERPAPAHPAMPRSPLAKSNSMPQAASPQLTNPGSADVELLTEPPGALVTVDGRSGKSCTAPCTLLLPAGRHVLTAQLQGYSVAQRIFNTPETSSLIIALGANLGTLIVTSSPAGATIAVDGREAGRCPITLHLSAGQHRVEALSGGQVQEQTVNIQADSIQGATFNLR